MFVPFFLFYEIDCALGVSGRSGKLPFVESRFAESQVAEGRHLPNVDSLNADSLNA